LGAFLAGVLLSESTFRHQLEADIEPFRGILLGLFFISVGMSLDLTVFREQWLLILAGTAALMLVKAAGVYAVARLICAKHPESLYRAVLLAQGGEFAFVLYAAAAAAGILDARTSGVLTAAGLARHSHGATVRIAGAVVVKQHPETAKGHVFLSLEDETGMANVIIRPATYRQHKRVLDANAAVVVTGTLQSVDGATSVLAQRLDGLALFVKIAAREWQ